MDRTKIRIAVYIATALSVGMVWGLLFRPGGILEDILAALFLGTIAIELVKFFASQVHHLIVRQEQNIGEAVESTLLVFSLMFHFVRHLNK